MNDAEKKAFSEVYVKWKSSDDMESPYEHFWKKALEWRDSQVGEPVKAAKYFAISDLKETYIQLDYRTNQLEIYEEENDVPKDILDGRKIIPVYISKHPPAAQINQQLLEALERIAAIEDQLQGGDWDEIEEAREIAKAALAAAKETK